MNTLSWLLYGADVLNNLGTFFTVIGIVSLIIAIPTTLCGYIIVWDIKKDRSSNEIWFEPRKYVRIVAILALVVGIALNLISIIIPSKQTMYMIAASEMGEVVIKSDEGAEIYNELKAIVMNNLKSVSAPQKTSN